MLIIKQACQQRRRFPAWRGKQPLPQHGRQLRRHRQYPARMPAPIQRIVRTQAHKITIGGFLQPQIGLPFDFHLIHHCRRYISDKAQRRQPACQSLFRYRCRPDGHARIRKQRLRKIKRHIVKRNARRQIVDYRDFQTRVLPGRVTHRNLAEHSVLLRQQVFIRRRMGRENHVKTITQTVWKPRHRPICHSLPQPLFAKLCEHFGQQRIQPPGFTAAFAFQPIEHCTLSCQAKAT
ncbi:hypothetical protein HMPREF2541_09595 [Eikenella sp. HMSC061C02]|nr:hypothetical protein A7P84_11190 [Eikenella corrodens]OFN59771.1 hypothetical protein HMPREF2541_09595 [Eikenella sp. HMSC061C02]